MLQQKTVCLNLIELLKSYEDKQLNRLIAQMLSLEEQFTNLGITYSIEDKTNKIINVNSELLTPHLIISTLLYFTVFNKFPIFAKTKHIMQTLLPIFQDGTILITPVLGFSKKDNLS